MESQPNHYSCISPPISTLLSYIDADWGGYPDTCRSTFSYCVFLGDNLVSWSARRQPTISKFSSAEAEYCGIANIVSETCWIRNVTPEFPHVIYDFGFVKDRRKFGCYM